MAQFATLDTEGKPTQAVRRLLADLIDKGVVEAVLTPARQGPGNVVMQTLVSDARKMELAEPLAPVVWTNAGTLVSSLTYNPTGTPVAAVMRSCEVRAFVERTKLNQGSRENLLLIGLDCLGRFENRDYLALARRHEDLTAEFLAHAAAGNAEAFDGVHVTNACNACEFPVAPSVDLRLCLIGVDTSREVVLEALTESGERALSSLGLPACEAPSGRGEATRKLEGERVAFRDALFATYREKTATVDGLIEATAACINCYNCRVACPVCYCRECVFTTDLFRHNSSKYLMWSRKKGMVKMPTDTLFYHLTRMIHMSTMCVGCGQCSSACPNDIDVMEMFRTTAEDTQARFDYLPGRDFDEKLPMATFHEDELQDVSGPGK